MTDLMDYVVQVTETTEALFANELLALDWILLSVGQDPYGIAHYVLGRIEDWTKGTDDSEVKALAQLLFDESRRAVETGPLTEKGALEDAVEFLGRQ